MKKRATLAIALFVLLATAGFADSNSAAVEQVLGSGDSTRGLVAKIRILKKSGGRVCWSPKADFIAMDRKGLDGYYDVYLIRPDGSDERCLTDRTDGAVAGGNNGQPAWHPSGRLLVFQSEKKDSVGRWGRDIASTPGLGQHSDLWLMDLEHNTFHRLTNTPNREGTGVLHAHFSPDGKWLSWSEGYRKGRFSDHKGSAGYWRLKVAKFSYGPAGPHLSDVRTFEPGGPAFYENHGFSKDGKRLVYTSNCEARRGAGFLKSTRIYQLDLETGQVQKLTNKGYNETAHYTPSGKHIVWMTSLENPNRGTDYWVMKPDGTAKRRVTDFNYPGNPGYKRRLIVAADHSFSPCGTKFAAYLQLDLIKQVGMTVIVELDPDKTKEL